MHMHVTNGMFRGDMQCLASRLHSLSCMMESTPNGGTLMQKQGLEFKLGQKVTGTEVSGDRVTLKYEAVKDGKASEITADIVLVSTGRRPVTGTSFHITSGAKV